MLVEKADSPRACRWRDSVAAAGSPHNRSHDHARIISLVPALTEMLFAVGAGPQVVAVSSYDEFPPDVKSLPRVGALLDPDVERILSLRPDLVVIYGSQTDLQAQLGRTGIRVYNYRHAGLAGVLNTIRDLGAAVGHATEGERLARDIRSTLDRLRVRVQGRPKPRVLLVFERDPASLRGVFVSGGVVFLRPFSGPRVRKFLPRNAIVRRRSKRSHAGAGCHPRVRATGLLAATMWRRRACVGDPASIPAVRNGRIQSSMAILCRARPRVPRRGSVRARLHPDAFNKILRLKQRQVSLGRSHADQQYPGTVIPAPTVTSGLTAWVHRQAGVLEAQARAAGLSLIVVPIPHPCSNEVYEAQMRTAVTAAIEAGFTHVAFGDLFLEDVRRYREDRLAGSGLTLLFPVWGIPTRRLAEQMIATRLRARLACVDTRVLAPPSPPRDFNRTLLEISVRHRSLRRERRVSTPACMPGPCQAPLVPRAWRNRPPVGRSSGAPSDWCHRGQNPVTLEPGARPRRHVDSRLRDEQLTPPAIVCLTEETTETLYPPRERPGRGVSGYTVRPPEARKNPRVSAFIHARYERIDELDPDLILGFSDLRQHRGRADQKATR